ncbi:MULTISPECIES: hypothetical protein [unclassified Anabaena]|uniref:hypothetical protein n=1 Tax=unclassified Anabaena TaxID=2619674 RepID=UPI0008336EDB|nr:MULTISPECIES: hypothetical protein [unclassified Anabaena]
MFKILIDADLILEALMNRTALTTDVRQLLERVHPSIQMYLTDVGLQKIYAYAACLKTPQIADIVINWLLEQVQICLVDQNLLQTARVSPVKDFESAVELVCWQHYQLNAIITNKPEDFLEAADECCVWSFADLWLRVNLENQLQVPI